MHHEQKDAGHDVDHEIAPNGRPAHPQNREHDIEHANKDHRLQDVDPDGGKGIIVLLAHRAHDGVVDEFEEVNGRAEIARVGAPWLKHRKASL